MSSVDNRVLFVSKPVAPPWNDSSKNLVKDVAAGLQKYKPVVLTFADEAGAPQWRPANGEVRTPYVARSHRYAPGLYQNLRVARMLALARGLPPIWNFFFAPNPKSSAVARHLARLRGAKTVQTICSQPKEWRVNDLFGDALIAVSISSDSALKRLSGWPVHYERGRRISDRPKIHCIPPCVEIPAEPQAGWREALRAEFGLAHDRRVLLYPGDLEFGGGAELVLRAFEGAGAGELVLACRDKTAEAASCRERLRRQFSHLEAEGRLRWLGETPRILDWISAVDAVLLPSSDLYGKMDLPLVLLEAMARKTTVLVHDATPAASLTLGGALTTNGEVAHLRKKIGKLLSESPRWFEERGARHHRWVVENCSPAVSAARYEAVYKELETI